MSAEEQRLLASSRRDVNWQRWGPYLSERQWGTVREDYSATGECWSYFTHDQARSRAYRWGEDGLLGICDRECRLCFALALWNGRDPILKERLFGLTGPEGNHGEDVKECYYYLDATPTYSYMQALYKYPQREYPYERLISENRFRGREQREFELADTGIFDENRYFDVFAEYAKAGPNDILIRIHVANRGPQQATLHLLPTLWFRNTWVWGCEHDGCEIKPRMEIDPNSGGSAVLTDHASLYKFRWSVGKDPAGNVPPLLFTENETNMLRAFDFDDGALYTKDAFHEYVVQGRTSVVNPQQFGTKAAAHYVLEIPPGETQTVQLRLTSQDEVDGDPFAESFEQTFQQRIAEGNEFYAERRAPGMTETEANVSRQAIAGLLWSKQFYHYIVKDWLQGDPNEPTPPHERWQGRNHDWMHLHNRNVISMPDKWEYPWYAAWDLAFHMLPMAAVDGHFAKEQLLLLMREWYMHANGQMPAYEFALGDVNPPVHAWACWRVYKMTGHRGERDRVFLQRAFHKLLLNFTWWVNRKDPAGRNLFAGGFLGLDNIGVFDRSQPLPHGGYLEQADGTAWMAFYCTTMLAIALELASEDPSYEDIATKFFQHFIAITDAINCLGGTGLWDDQDGFYYDELTFDGTTMPLRIRSMVGLIPLFAVEALDQDVIDRLPSFKRRLDWFLEHRQDLARHITCLVRGTCPVNGDEIPHRLLAIPARDRLARVLKYLFSEDEFLSPYGIRALSRYHLDHPYIFKAMGQEQCVRYEPGESQTGMFGGNSNWRGPVWFPVNFLLIEALQRYHYFYGDDFQVEFPTGSGRMMNLNEAAHELTVRLSRLFLPNENGQRPCHGGEDRYANDPHWRDLVLFYEYFDGDNGRGLGASHQTGWTALVSLLLHDIAKHRA